MMISKSSKAQDRETIDLAIDRERRGDWRRKAGGRL